MNAEPHQMQNLSMIMLVYVLKCIYMSLDLYFYA